MRTLRKSRYHSKVILGDPVSGMAAALVQYLRSEDPPLTQPASSHVKPTNRRIGSHTRPARELLNRNRANAGPSISTRSLSGASLRSRNSATTSTMEAIQNAHVVRFLTVPSGL